VGRLGVFVAAVLLAATPAVIGLFGNASFSTDVPVRVPGRATLLDRSGRPMPATAPRPDEDSGRRRDSGPGREPRRRGRGSRPGLQHPAGQEDGGQP
jgi:hypothetical protein